MTYHLLGASHGQLVFVKNGCRKCHETGRLGFCAGKPVPCSCVVLKKVPKAKKPSRWKRFMEWLKRLFTARQEVRNGCAG